MAPGFDELIEHLLAEIALCGDKGASVNDFRSAVRSFYTGSDVAVDVGLLKQVWQWVGAHSDISVEGVSSDADLGFLDDGLIVPSASDHGDRSVNGQPHVGHEDNQNAEHNIEGSLENHDASVQKSATKTTNDRSDVRLHTSQERVWLALTGHGVDWSRVPRKEFELLSVIVRYREQGIMQPELVRLTGQDKRSVPKRTDVLAKNGYIVKETLAAYKTRTSLLIHRRFKQEDAKSSSDAVFSNGSMILGNFFDFLFEMFERQQVIGQRDLRRVLGIEGQKLETRKFTRALRHLVKLGLIGTVKAKWQVDGKRMHYAIKSIKMLRTPTPVDRKAFLLYKKQEEIGPAREAVDEEDDDDHSQPDSEIGEEDEEMIVENFAHHNTIEDFGQETSNTQEQTPGVPQWTTTVPMTNLIFHIVNNAGKAGLNSGQLARRSVGTTWARPLDETITRLTDAWEKSQPPHLRHLSIIRDTKPYGSRGVQYVYRSLAGHREAVANKEATWEGLSKTASKNASTVLKPTEIDQWGFPQPRASSFVDPSGYLSLSRCYDDARIRSERTSTDPILATRPDGTETIVWPAPDEDFDIASPSNGKSRRKPGASRLGRRPGGSMFEGVETTSLEYQRLYREMRKQEQLNATWEARAQKLAEWRACQEAIPDGPLAPTNATERITSFTSIATITEDQMTPKKRGRPRKKRTFSEVEGHALDEVDASQTQQNVPNTPKKDSPVTPASSQINRHAPTMDNADGRILEPAADFEQRVARHLAAVLSIQAPGAYRDVPRTRRKNLPPYTMSTVMLIKSERLREFNGTPDVIEANGTQSLTDQVQVDGSFDDSGGVREEQALPPQVAHVADEHSERDGVADADIGASPRANLSGTADTERPVASEAQHLGGPLTPLHDRHSFVSDRSNATNDGRSQTRPNAPSLGSPIANGSAGAERMERSTTVPIQTSSAEHTTANESAEDERPEDHEPSSVLNQPPTNDDEPSPFRAPTARNKMRLRQGVQISGGSAARVRTSILQDMLERCGGLMPGGSDLVQPFVAAFQARIADAPAPDRDTIQRAVKNLRDQGLVKYFDFTLRGRNGKEEKKRIIALQHLTERSGFIKELMKKMQSAHPLPYLPEAIWEPGTAAQPRPRVLFPGQNSLSRIPPKDESATVQILQPSPQQLNQAQKVAAREEKRLAREAARQLKKEKDAAKAAAARKKAQKDAEKKAAEAADRQRDIEQAESLQDQDDPASLVAHKMPHSTSVPNIDEAMMSRDPSSRIGRPILPYYVGPNLQFAVQQFNGQGSDFFPRNAADPLGAAMTMPYWPQNTTSNLSYDTNNSTLPQLAPKPPDFIPMDPVALQPPPGPPRPASTAQKRSRPNEVTEEDSTKPTLDSGAKRRKTIGGYGSSPADGQAAMKSSQEMTSEQMLRLLHAYTAAKALASGLDGAVNWAIIDEVFRDDSSYSKPIFKSKWNTITKGRIGLTEGMMTDFQTSYLAAYEAGDVPSVNYSRMEETDWNAIVQWSLRTLSVSLGELPSLPSSRERLEHSYKMEETAAYVGRERGRFHKENISELHRSELLHELPFQVLHPSSEDALVSLSLHDAVSNDISSRLEKSASRDTFGGSGQLFREQLSDDASWTLMLAKSNVRADVFTPKEVYKLSHSRRKLALFPDLILEEATRELENRRVITKLTREASKSRLPDTNRPYTINIYLENALKGYCYIQSADLENAVAFKKELDEAFRNGEGSVDFPFHAHDGMNLATTNLTANERVRTVAILPPFDDSIGAPLPHISKWGWNAGDYKGSKTDQISMEMIRLEIQPTSAYEFGVPTALRKNGRFPTPPPVPDVDGKVQLLPLWLDINGNLMEEWWTKLVCYIVQTVHLRPFIGVEELTEGFKGLVWQWEVQLVLRWAEHNGLLSSTDEIDDGGRLVRTSWRASEYWWLCLAKEGELGSAESFTPEGNAPMTYEE